MSRDASELLSEPMTFTRSETPDAPVTTVLNNLTVTDGPKLTILTRTNPNLAAAAQIGFIFSHMYGSSYVGKRVDLIKCLAISMDGKGREEQISALQAGGKLPDSYFEGAGSSDFDEAR